MLLLDISRRGVVLQRFRGHDAEVQSVVWAPQLGEEWNVLPENDKGMLNANLILYVKHINFVLQILFCQLLHQVSIF